VVLHKQVDVNLKFPDQKILDIFRKDLLLAGCPLRADLQTLTLTFPQSFEKQIKLTCQAIKKELQITINAKGNAK